MSTYQELIDKLQNGTFKTPQDLFEARLAIMREIEKATGRPLIVYAANFIHPGPGSSIDLDDVVGFSDLVEAIQGPTIDVFLHSPGGSPEAAERLVLFLRNRFTDLRFIVPHSAYSAATMMTLAGTAILLDDRSALGPIDPQIFVPSRHGGRYVPADDILEGFKNTERLIEDKGPKALTPYLPLIEKYDLHLFELCKNAQKLADTLAREWLQRYMFGQLPAAEREERTARGRVPGLVEKEEWRILRVDNPKPNMGLTGGIRHEGSYCRVARPASGFP